MHAGISEYADIAGFIFKNIYVLYLDCCRGIIISRDIMKFRFNSIKVTKSGDNGNFKYKTPSAVVFSLELRWSEVTLR